MCGARKPAGPAAGLLALALRPPAQQQAANAQIRALFKPTMTVTMVDRTLTTRIVPLARTALIADHALPTRHHPLRLLRDPRRHLLRPLRHAATAGPTQQAQGCIFQEWARSQAAQTLQSSAARPRAQAFAIASARKCADRHVAHVPLALHPLALRLLVLRPLARRPLAKRQRSLRITSDVTTAAARCIAQPH